MADQTIIERVQKLLALSRDSAATPGEVATAAALAQKLIERHNIESVLLSAAGKTPQGTPEEPIGEEIVFTFAGPRLVTWTLHLLTALGEVNGCKVWCMQGFRSLSNGSLVGAGRPSDLAAIRYMLAYLSNEVERLSEVALRKAKRDNALGSFGKTWTNSFKLGAVSEISSRIREESRKAREEMQNPELAYKRALECGDNARVIELDNAPKYELAIIQQALATLDNRKKSAEEWANSKHKFKAPKSGTSAKNYDAYTSGREAGKTVNLSTDKRLGG